MTAPAKRIMIVEGEPIVALALADMIQSFGWQSFGVASRLDDAMALLNLAEPDAAILDVNLNGELSYPLADILADRAVPFAFATGYGAIGHPERHRDVTTLTKPYVDAEMRLAIARLLIA